MPYGGEGGREHETRDHIYIYIYTHMFIHIYMSLFYICYMCVCLCAWHSLFLACYVMLWQKIFTSWLCL